MKCCNAKATGWLTLSLRLAPTHGLQATGMSSALIRGDRCPPPFLPPLHPSESATAPAARPFPRAARCPRGSCSSA